MHLHKPCEHLIPDANELRFLQEMERLFCPTCGNAALQKVEMVIGENGAEQYGVRKKHVIRGTRFSLPKPKASPICSLLLRQLLLAMFPCNLTRALSTIGRQGWEEFNPAGGRPHAAHAQKETKGGQCRSIRPGVQQHELA